MECVLDDINEANRLLPQNSLNIPYSEWQLKNEVICERLKQTLKEIQNAEDEIKRAEEAIR